MQLVKAAKAVASVTVLASVLALTPSVALTLTVEIRGADTRPLDLVMVTRLPANPPTADASDKGYPMPGKIQQGTFELTRFSNADGKVEFPDEKAAFRLRLRKPGFRDLVVAPADLHDGIRLTMAAETDALALAEQNPSNAWTSTLSMAIPDADKRKQFMAQCGFCHQQGSANLRRSLNASEWETAIKRMMRYGSRLSSELQKQLPALLEAHWRTIHDRPDLVPDATPWRAHLAGAAITELPIGDSFSQMHDLLAHSNGKVYVGDNLQDRVYEIDPNTGAYTVYRIPPAPGDTLGGLLAGRLRDFPKHETYQGIHSLAESPKDGHIFITASYQRRLIEFDPTRKSFARHEMSTGFYPHTLRIDSKDRVWFTLALSNQLGMLDRTSGQFTHYDLPFRSIMERLTVRLTPFFFTLIGWGIPVANWVKVDDVSTGVPLPYGIDITPDGKVWIARLHTDEIASIDPDTAKVTMIRTPLHAPRRLRADSDGNLWIAMYSESAILRYQPENGAFTKFDLPVVPKGSDTPYSLNVDRKNRRVWVTGTNSDSVQCLDITSDSWRFFPLPRRATFTRDVEFGTDGRVFLSSASFPSWHIEDGQPTLIQLDPNGAGR
ncbi:Vgb family protein [Bradyrhizobium sp.]|uniref:Vgb family protein n=1 Tax=Bradyrhizobium sp. TaxID=376 RepID=UPI0040384503